MTDFQIFAILSIPTILALVAGGHGLYAWWKDRRPLEPLLDGDTSDELDEQS